MAFAQINYTQKLGNGPYTIKEIGCFLTAFSNLLERFGEAVAPDALNNFFIQHGTYLTDPSDHVKEDLAWGSVTAYDPTIHLTGSGEGAPPAGNNNTIVKFIYKSVVTGALTTHFCLVDDIGSGLIVDSWDGKVKPWSVYGGPKAWASYAKTGGQTVAPVQPISTPAPAAQPATLFTVQPITAKKVQLKLNPTHLWNLNEGSWSAMGANPVSSQPGGTVVEVSAIAHHKLGGAYYMTDPNKAEGYNVVDCTDYTEVVPAPAPGPAKPQNVVFTKLDKPLTLVAKRQPTNVWDLSFADDAPGDAHAKKQLPEGTTFVAYGKAQRTDHDKPAYFMTQEDFGSADTTGIPANYEGVNTVDLGTPPAPATPVTSTTPAAPVEGDKIDVKVIPTAPDAWQKTFTRNLGPVKYLANTNAVIKDQTGLGPDTQLVHGQVVMVGGQFTGPDGKLYLRTVHGLANNTWYGIPPEDVVKEQDIQDENFLQVALGEADQIRQSIPALRNGKDKALAAAGSVEGVFNRILHRKKNN